MSIISKNPIVTWKLPMSICLLTAPQFKKEKKRCGRARGRLVATGGETRGEAAHGRAL